MPEGSRPLAGRRALVTGSTAGLGHAIADRLAGEGCDVILNGLVAAGEGDGLARTLAERHGVRALFHGADLSRPDEIEALVHASESMLGGVDILVNNAVVRSFAPIERMGADDWNRALAVNLSAPFHLIRLTLSGMRARAFGRIVNVSSVYGLMATVDRTDYVSTKTGLIGLTRAVALETASDDITCNAICPGTLPTPAILGKIRDIATASGVSDEEATREYLAARQPSGRFVSLESVAATVAFLCGPGGEDITGTILPIDGGWAASS